MRTISTNARENGTIAIVHLFEFVMRDLDSTNAVDQTLRFTDHDIFVKYAGNEYTPLAVSFDKLSEDISMKSNNVTLTIDNINGELTKMALSAEWRNNACLIRRIIFTPPSEVFDGDTYEYGISSVKDDNEVAYPQIDFSQSEFTGAFDEYLLFQGVIDKFSATEQALRGTLSTEFIHWNKKFPKRTYNQNEFNTIINAVTGDIYWGGKKPV